MGFFSRLASRNLDWKHTLVRDMVLISIVDGDLDEKEIMTLGRISMEMGVPKNVFQKIFNNPESAKDVYPTDTDDCLEYIQSLIRIIYADGFIHQDEVAFAMIIAGKMGIHPSIVTDSIEYIESSLD